MNEVMEKEVVNIENMIYEVRGVQVMLSSDVAKLYNVETKVLNQTWKELDTLKGFPLTWNSIVYSLKAYEEKEISIGL